LYNRDKEEIYTEKREDISIVEKRERRDIQVY